MADQEPVRERRGDDEGPAPGLRFPDLPRMELDLLLRQVVERAQEVITTQGRLRGLLRANQIVSGELDLGGVLRRIVEAARELVGARYAALGVIAPEGGLAEFVHVGMSAETVADIGHLPQGKGLLGALIDEPRPIRIKCIADDVRSSGFPRQHPPMKSFLGVPIRVRGEVFGNLYLAESTKGEFSAEDEELTEALAATAGVAIENARLYEGARTRQEWLRASAAIARRLLSADAGRPLELIAEHTREIADADLVTVVLPDGGGELHVEVAVGRDSDQLPGMPVPLEGSLSGQVFTTGRPLRVSTPTELPGLASVASGGLDVGPVLVLPLAGSNGMHGVLTAARLRGRPAFGPDDLDMAGGFANQASIALELAEGRAEQQRAAMLDERDRIAADLHDRVIQRLFAAGLSLQGIASGLSGTPRKRILDTIGDLDATIDQIRATIFQLHRVSPATLRGYRAALMEVIAEVAVDLGFQPGVRFAGPVEDDLPADVADDLVAVLREALTTVIRQMHTRSVEVEVETTPGRITLDVRVDGAGTAVPAALASLRSRAERHGGDLTVLARNPSGTRLRWSVPLG